MPPFTRLWCLQSCALFGVFALTCGLRMEPQVSHVKEFGSVNITCRRDKLFHVLMFNSIDENKNIKGTSTVNVILCTTEGPLADTRWFEYFCGEKTLIVTLKNVNRTLHNEHYACRVAFEYSNIATIRVQIPVNTITLINASSSPVPAIEGMNTHFDCVTDHVYPEPSIVWFANSTSIQPNDYDIFISQKETIYAYPQSYRSILTMRPNRYDNFTIIHCEANNTFGWVRSRDVHMVVYFGPDIPVVTGSGIPVTEQITVIMDHQPTLVCTSQSYPAPFSYKWLIDKDVIADGSIMHIAEAFPKPFDYITKNVTCRAENEMRISNGVHFRRNETHVTVEILYSSHVKTLSVNRETERVTVNENDEVMITCDVVGNPSPTASIMFQDMVLKSEEVQQTLNHTIHGVTCDQMGLYECQSFNEYNMNSSSTTIQIDVTCSPRPVQNAPLLNYFTSALFEDITIHLQIYAFPEPGERGFRWQRLENNTSSIELRNDTSTSITTTGLRSILTLRNFTVQMFGNYSLMVDNGFGSYTHAFEIAPQDKPLPPEEFHNVDGLTRHSSICMSWRPSFNGGMHQSFILEYCQTMKRSKWTAVTLEDSGETVMTYTISSLQSNTSYSFRIVSTNDIGNSSTVGPLTVNTKVSSFRRSSTALVTTMTIAIILSVSLCIGVAIGILLFIRRHKTNISKSPQDVSFQDTMMASASVNDTEGRKKSNYYENVAFSLRPTTENVQERCESLSQTQKGTKRRSSTGRKSAFRIKSTPTEPDDSSLESQNVAYTKRKSTSSENLYVNRDDRRSQTKLSVNTLSRYVTNNLYSLEFSALPKDLQYPVLVARKPENIALNRYNGILPYDHSRVVLQDDPSFFMNASYIDSYKKRKAYIASLGPTEETSNKFHTFWKMMWYHESDIIVMLTNTVEVTGMKYQQYWPDHNKQEQYGEVTVFCSNVEVFAEYTIRTFRVTKEDEGVRDYHHLHFTAWPDKSVPDSLTSLLEFRQRLLKTETTGNGPIVVHCSAGIGRTGTFIAINNLIEEGKQEGSVDVYACVNRLREQRVNMVQTEQQYDFIYKTLVYALQFDTDNVTVDRFQHYIESKNDAFFEDMFERLELNFETTEEVNERLTNQKTMLNRTGADIPAERHRVRLFVDKRAGDSDYINAVFVNSLKRTNYYIAAQTPTYSTREDFLLMVYQEHCVCIIDLGESALQTNIYQNEDVGMFLPPDNLPLTIGNFKVSNTKLETRSYYTTRRLKIKHQSDIKIQNEERDVLHFQYTGWDMDKLCPNDPSEFVSFIMDIDQSVTNHSDPSGRVLVHCLDGSGRRGLFCSVATMIEKIISDYCVNVGSTIRNIRSRRKSAIQNMQQLRFCHLAINAFINMFKH